jgi:hypothetical protein
MVGSTRGGQARRAIPGSETAINGCEDGGITRFTAPRPAESSGSRLPTSDTGPEPVDWRPVSAFQRQNPPALRRLDRKRLADDHLQNRAPADDSVVAHVAESGPEFPRAGGQGMEDGRWVARADEQAERTAGLT